MWSLDHVYKGYDHTGETTPGLTSDSPLEVEMNKTVDATKDGTLNDGIAKVGNIVEDKIVQYQVIPEYVAWVAEPYAAKGSWLWTCTHGHEKESLR